MEDETPVKIAFHIMGNANWIAGATALECLFHALRHRRDNRPAIALTSWDNQADEDRMRWQDWVDEHIVFPARCPPGQSRTALLAARGVDVFFSLPIQTALEVDAPRMTWIYDFQHRHYPGFFTGEDIAQKERLFLMNAETARVLLVTSEDVKKDFDSYPGRLTSKVRVLPFVPYVPGCIYERPPDEWLAPLRLPDKFFFLPNQFLPHKNHLLVLQALTILKNRGTAVTVICTGRQSGTPFVEACYRELMHECKRRGLDSQFIMHGPVSRLDYFALVRQAVALLTPTLFEGFGLTVAEARDVGKRVVLSDLPVLREHNHPKATWFNPHDAEELAGRLEELWRHSPPGPDPDFETAARIDYDARLVDFGRSFMLLANNCLDSG